jgi:hypothetical protein
MKYKGLRIKIRNAITALIVLAFVSILSYSVESSSSGKTGHTSSLSSGCGSCHGSSASSSTTLGITSGSGSFSVAAGSTTSFTLTVSNASQSKAGFNLGVFTTETGNTKTGTITAGTGSKVVGGELTHSAPKTMSSGSTSFSFSWTAPSTPGTYYMRAIGNAVNGNFSADSGDDWNWMSVQQITVTSPTTITLSAPDGGEEWCAGSSQNITWNSSGVTNVKIELSTNGGTSYDQVLVASTPAASGSWAWSIPGGQAAADNYRVRISDASSPSVNDESAANFSIGGAPMITAQPQGSTVCEGEPLSLSIAASGGGLSYQWYFNNSEVPGATMSSYTVPVSSPFLSGSYKCIVSSPCGSNVESNEVTVTVNLKTVISGHPESGNVCQGQNLTLAVTAAGENISYQWMKDGNNISGANSATYQIMNATANDAGSYTCFVDGECGSDLTSSPAELTVGTATSISEGPMSQDACEGSELVLSVSAEGTNVMYQWKKDGNDIAGATESSFTIAEFSASDVAVYTCEVTGDCGEAKTTDDAVIKMKPLAVITSQPSGGTVLEGENFSIEVAADGENLMWQWFKDDQEIGGATSNKLELANVAQSDAGFYYVQITNDCGTVTSQVVELSVTPAGSGAVLTFNIKEFDFGNIPLDAPATQSFMDLIENTGDQDLEITSISVTGEDKDAFEITAGGDPLTLKPGETHSISVKFAPIMAGEYSGEIRIESNTIGSQTSFPINGIGGLYSLSSNEIQLMFGDVDVNMSSTQSFTLSNDGDLDITIQSFDFGGQNPGLFQVVSPSLPSTLNPSATQMVEVEFTPTGTGTVSATLSVNSVEHDDIDLTLSGNGITSVEDKLNVASVDVYPVPATNKINLRIDGLQAGKMNISVVDVLGNKIYTENNIVVTSNSYLFEWDLIGNNNSRLASGTYLLQIDIDGKTDAVPFVVE